MCTNIKITNEILLYSFYTTSLKSGVDFALYKVFMSQLELTTFQVLNSPVLLWLPYWTEQLHILLCTLTVIFSVYFSS